MLYDKWHLNVYLFCGPAFEGTMQNHAASAYYDSGPQSMTKGMCGRYLRM